MVPRAQTVVPTLPALPSGYEQHKTIDEYLRLGPDAPIKSLVEEVADNQANAQEALCSATRTTSTRRSPTSRPAARTRPRVPHEPAHPEGRLAQAIEDMLNNETPADPSDDFIAILGSAPSTPQAGYPQITIPMGYNDTLRRTVDVNVFGGAYSEFDLIGVAYVIEQGTLLRKPASEVNPSMYRCAKTKPAPPYAKRGDCNPDYDSLARQGAYRARPRLRARARVGAEACRRMTAGTLTSEALRPIARIALANAEGPALQAVRSLNPDRARSSEASALDNQRRHGIVKGPLRHSGAADGRRRRQKFSTTGGSIARCSTASRGRTRSWSRSCAPRAPSSSARPTSPS